MLASPLVPLPRFKPFRALRYDTRRAGPLEDLVAPPHDVLSSDDHARLLAASPWNVVRLIRPETPAEAAATLQAWRAEGVLVREERPAVWVLEDDFAGPDGRARTRRALVARIRLERYGEGNVYPHERTIAGHKAARLELLRAVRAKLSPLLLLHEGESPDPREGPPHLEVEHQGIRSRLWRVDDPAEIERALAAVRGRAIIADGHHRYETALRFHEEEGTEETAHALAALVADTDPGLVIFPTHRVAGGPVPELNGRFRVTPLEGGAAAAVARLEGVPRDRPAFAMLRRGRVLLAEAEPAVGTPALDTAVLEELPLRDVRFTASADEAERAVATGAAEAAFLVRAPTVDQVEAVALAGQTMPEKSTYFFPKLTSGLLFSPFDE
jgi:uncharacterized protein (DUF1015 family)